jgi:SAM-dependent methyltransferase
VGGDTDIDAYDRIAQWYDVDMARHMTHDDVGFYRSLARDCGGPVLEEGCGNGRILLELLADGCDAVGADRSAGMLAALQDKARARRLPPRVARMDVRALGLTRGFALVLCPYSLVTYMLSDDDAAQLCGEARRVLRADGALVVDAFVPRERVAADAFCEDYRRPWAGGELARARRITALPHGLNRIERRYAWRDGTGAIAEQAHTAEVIRPCAPEALHALLARNGFAVTRTWWDYGARTDARGAQFVTLLARPR